jgi:hypothetical protein
VEEAAVTLDHLLLWLSAKGAGSWPQFRAAVEEFQIEQEEAEPKDLDAGDRPSSGLPVYHEVRLALQRLGHVEFRAGDGAYSWRVVPPSLALLPGDRAILCGARSDALLERLHEVAQVEELPVEGMPRRITLSGAPAETIADRARAHGLHVQEAAPIAILCATPGVRDVATWQAVGSMPETQGWVVHRFSASHLQWVPVLQDQALGAGAGLFRFVLKHQRFYYLRWRGRSFKVPVQVGKYAVMHRHQARLSFEADRRVFSLPAICRPPLLIERALVLCSGVLPRFDASSARVEYAEVPPDVARLASQLLCQEVR